MKKLLALLLAAIMALSLIACGAPADPAPAAPETTPTLEVQDHVESNMEIDEATTYKKTVTIAYDQKHTTMDPQLLGNVIQDTLYNMVFNQLVTFNSAEKKIDPELAKSWEMKDGGKTWTFELRDDIKFHNGETMTADDVLFSYERAVATGVATASWTALIESVTVDGDYTITYNLTSPNMDYLYTMALTPSSVFNRKACEADPEKGHEVGTGGWKIDTWSANEYVDFVRFDDSWVWAEKTTPTEKVTFKIMTEASARGVAVQTGEVDIAFRPNLNELKNFEQDENVDYFVMQADTIEYLGFNHNIEKYQDVNLRKAISHALNVQEILDIATEGYGYQASSVWAPSQYGYFIDFAETYGYNLDLAKEYLAKSNYPDGTSVRIISRNDYATYAEVIQAQLAAINITAEVVTVDTPGFNAMSDNNELELFLLSRTCGPNGDFHRSLICAPNRSAYDNPRITELMDLALAETDEATRLGYYKEVQELMNDEAAFAPISYPVTHALFNKGVSGVIWESSRKHDYTFVVCAE